MHLGKALGALTLAATIAIPSIGLAADPTGTWQTSGGESRYRVSLCGDGTQLCAKLTWLRADARTADNLPYLNRYVVQGATASDATHWQGQLSYAGDTYDGKLTMVSANAMKLSGCKGVFCKTLNFTRVRDVANL